MKIIRTKTDHPDFRNLVEELDKELAERDGKDHDFYQQYNGLEDIKHVVLIKKNDKTLACGAIKEWNEEIMEIKRMYTAENFRGKGFATKILTELENWAAELGYEECLLETGIKQPEAIALYLKQGYERIGNYGQYEGVETSRCFKKKIA